MELDLDGFRFAGRIGIDGWRRADSHYISFLKGKGDVADYFREFLGCDEKERSKADTLDFVEAVTSFADAAEMPAAKASCLHEGRQGDLRGGGSRADRPRLLCLRQPAPSRGA